MDIEDLLGQPVPDWPDYHFGEASEVRADGDVRRVPVYNDNELVTEVGGVTGDDLLREAQAACEAHVRGTE